MPIAVKLPLYAILAIVSGFVMDQCTKLVTQETLNVALVGTIGVFTTMLAVGYVLTLLGTDFTVLGMMLAGALVALMAWYVIPPFLLKNTTKTKKIATVVSLVIFSLFVAYDTNVILRRDYYGDFVTASLDYTLDFFHIFIDIATLIGNKQQVY
jgi:FtsH-binding integral membrane protein